MNVEMPPDIRETAAQLGAGVPYALKVLARQLADDPDMGQPSGLPGVFSVAVDGELFDDCPALSVGYIREPDRIEIRYVAPVPVAEPAVGDEVRGQDRAGDDGAGDGGADGGPIGGADRVLVGREVGDAWERITGWMRRRAPDSYRALRTGASPSTITGLESELGIRIPVDLRALWSLTSGDDGVDGSGCLPGNQAWIPVISFGATDRTSGLYLDAETGFLSRWSRFNEGPGDELDTLVTYLEEVADTLGAPVLAVRDTPGLVGGTLVWGSRLDAAQERRWQPLAG